jgi:hypothetical protein
VGVQLWKQNYTTTQHWYYQWIPIALLLVITMLKCPNFLLKIMEGNDIKHLTDGCEKDDETENKKDDEKVTKVK